MVPSKQELTSPILKYNTKELSEIFPKLTFNDVVEIALLRHPIPESVNYWDRVSLYYYACLNNQKDSSDYIMPLIDVPNTGSNYRKTSLGVWIAYRFSKLDVLRLGKQNNNLYMETIYNILLYKTSGESKIPEATFNVYNKFIKYFIFDLPSLCGTILTYEEIIEIIVICRVIYHEDPLYNVLLSGSHDIDYRRVLSSEKLASFMVMYCAVNCGENKVNNLLAKYGLRDKFDIDKYPKIDIKLITNKIIIKLRMRNEPELLESNIVRLMKKLYYLTEGNILEYLNYKYENVYGPYQARKIPISFYGISDSGFPIFNITMRLEITGTDNLLKYYHKLYNFAGM